MIYDAALTEEQKKVIQDVAAQLGLEGLRVVPIKGARQMRFVHDRRTVTVPWELLKTKQWADLRHLFRAVLDKAPVVATRLIRTEWDT